LRATDVRGGASKQRRREGASTCVTGEAGALSAAGRILADLTGSCPADVYGWDHPDGCEAACRSECAVGCWCVYAAKMAGKG